MTPFSFVVCLISLRVTRYDRKTKSYIICSAAFLCTLLLRLHKYTDKNLFVSFTLMTFLMIYKKQLNHFVILLLLTY